MVVHDGALVCSISKQVEIRMQHIVSYYFFYQTKRKMLQQKVRSYIEMMEFLYRFQKTFALLEF